MNLYKFLSFKIINNFLIASFFLASVFLFSSVSATSKLVLFTILFFLVVNLILLVFKEGINLGSDNTLFFAFLFFLIYILINTFFFSKILFESKSEHLNFVLYFISFYIFSTLEDEIDKTLNSCFFIVLVIFIFFYFVVGEEIIYFFTYNPNIFSGYCLFIFLFSLLSLKHQKLNIFVVLNLVFSFMFLVLLKNFSGMFISLFFLSLVFVKKKLYFYVLLTICLTLAVIFNFSSFFDRLIWFLIGFKVWVNNLFFGVGLGNFKFYYQQYSVGLPLTSTATLFVHNYFLQILTELGVFGGFFLFLILFLSFLSVDKKDKYLYPVLGILIHNLIDYNLIIPQNGILFFSFLGLMSKKKPRHKKFLFIFKNLIVIFLITYGIYNSFKILRVMNLLKNYNFIDAIKIDKTCWYAYKKIAEDEFNKKNFEKAKEYFLKTIRFNPVDADSYLYLSVIEFKRQQRKQAYKNFKKAIILNPKAAERYKEIIDRETK